MGGREGEERGGEREIPRRRPDADADGDAVTSSTIAVLRKRRSNSRTLRDVSDCVRWCRRGVDVVSTWWRPRSSRVLGVVLRWGSMEALPHRSGTALEGVDSCREGWAARFAGAVRRVVLSATVGYGQRLSSRARNLLLSIAGDNPSLTGEGATAVVSGWPTAWARPRRSICLVQVEGAGRTVQDLLGVSRGTRDSGDRRDRGVAPLRTSWLCGIDRGLLPRIR